MDPDYAWLELEEEPMETVAPMERRQSLSTSTETSIQFQSPLFSKLSHEIRCQIWEYVLDFGEPLHLMLQDDLFGEKLLPIIPDDLLGLGLHIADCERYWREYTPWVQENSPPVRNRIYAASTHNFAHGRCYEVFSSPQIPKLSGEHWQPLSLLQSCRRCYTECIDLLYSLNTFELLFPQGVFYFLSSIPSARLSKVKSITLYTDITPWRRGLHEEYERVLSLLESCTGLEKVRFFIHDFIMEEPDRYTEWFMWKLASRKKFKRGLWIERVMSYMQRDPLDQQTQSGQQDSGDEDKADGKEEPADTLRMHFHRGKKVRIDDGGS